MKRFLNWRLLAATGIVLVMVCALVIKANTARAGSGNANSNSNGYTISNNTPGFIKKATDTGAMDPSAAITATVWLKLHNTQQLDQLAAGQSQKGNANYQKWIDQATFNATYGATSQEVKSVQNFLTAHGLSLVTTSDDNSYVKVQGTVGAMEKAFHTQIDTYTLNGQTYYSNTSDPNINDASGAHVDAISLDNYGFHPNNVSPTQADGTPFKLTPLSSGSKGVFFAGQCFTGTETHTFTNTGVSATYSGNRYGTDINNTNLGQLPPCGYAPNELQSAYNMNALYSAGLDGSGQTVVITDAYGDPTIQQDAEVFSQVYGLPDLTSANFQVLRAPGAVNSGHGDVAGWSGEITLDVEWVHALAPGAKIDLVVGPNNNADLDEAINYAVVHHLGNTISNSWSEVEGFGNPARFNRDNRILEEAAVQGIDVNFSSGDNGDELANTGLKTVDFPGSSPFATSIGGTSLALNPDNSMAFQSGWGTNLTKIAGHATAGSPALSTPLNEGFIFGAGGGTSLTYAAPAWQQSALHNTMRQVPDVSMLADPYTGVEIIETDASTGQFGIGVIGGTSLACPMFSAIMAIASEKAGHGFGQAAPLMYGLQGTSALTDVTATTSATNVSGAITTTSGTTNYSADQLAAPTTNAFYSAFYNSPFSTNWFVITFGTDSSLTVGNGWDNVTGVGTPNGANFVNALGS